MSICATPCALAHGGVYRGPGSTVPPGGGSAGGPGTPVGPGGAAVTDWNVWWSFNRAAYLAVKDSVHAQDSLTGNDDVDIGKGQKGARLDSRPSPESLADEVVPGLLRALRSSDNQDLVGASLMALGKIGLDPAGDDPVQPVLESFLAHSNQEVAETAAVALGLFGRIQSAPLLVSLVSDSESGRKRVKRKEVPYRTRAFAAYGLGQLGVQSDRLEVRTLAVRTLFSTLRRERTPTPDLATACLLSIGLCPLPSGGSLSPELAAPRSVSRLEGQIAWLLEWFGEKNLRVTLRSHVPVTLAKLARAGAESHRQMVAQALLVALRGRGLEREVERAILIALGQLGDGDKDALDVALRAALQHAAGAADGPARALARISLARVLARPGTGEGHDEVLERGLAWLEGRLVHGKSNTRPWTAMALGLLAREQRLQNLPVSPSIALSLRTVLRGKQSPRDVGALCIALGLTADSTGKSEELLVKHLHQHADDGLRAAAALGLGLLGARDSREAIAQYMPGAEHRPGLLRELSTALILLGDRSALGQLVKGLREARTLVEQSSHAFAIGRIGDRRAVLPLLELLEDEQLSDSTRAFAAAALGVVAHDSALPWNAGLAADLQYGVVPSSLIDGARGVLDLL